MKVCLCLVIQISIKFDASFSLVLTWISIYYFSRAGPAASTRIYYEVMHSPDGFSSFASTKNKPTIPMGVSIFPKELRVTPKR